MVRRFGNRPGKIGLGCLFTLFLVVAGIWVGINVFEVYWRSYQLQDYVDEQAGFAPLVSDAVILRRLVAKSDTLGIALGQRDWNVRRGGNPPQVIISAEYRDSVVIEVLGLRKVFYIDFKPNARAAL